MNGCSGQSSVKYDLTNGGVHSLHLEIGEDLYSFGCVVIVQGTQFLCK